MQKYIKNIVIAVDINKTFGTFNIIFSNYSNNISIYALAAFENIKKYLHIIEQGNYVKLLTLYFCHIKST
jgi:hypothetical protein